MVVAFDVDGTLVDLAGAGSRAMGRAFREAFGIEDALARISFAGRTDRIIVRSALEAAGRRGPTGRADDGDVELLYSAYLALLPEEIAATPYRPTPGALGLLEALRASRRVVVGLATGNLPAATRMKLESAGIDGPFPFAAYGEAVEERAALVDAALASARALLPRGASATCWVVGDTPHDVAAARAVGARALAVAQGRSPIEDLRRHGPDLVVPDLGAALASRFWLVGEGGA